MRGDSAAADTLAPFKQSGNAVTYGNVLTIPIGERLLNVEPVYVSLAGSGGSYPILRYVLVSYNDQVGIGTTLIEALGQALGDTVPEPPDPGDPGDPVEPPTGTLDQQIRQLLDRAQAAFDRADRAYDEGDLGGYQDEVQQAQRLIAQALELADQRDTGEGGASSPTPSPTPSESESPSPE